MDLEASYRLHHAPAAVYAQLADLSTYPDWLGVVLRVVPAAPAPADAGPAWLVDIGARIGPLRRSKRVRMVRTEHLVGVDVCFERVETDGDAHPPWVLRARVAPAGDDDRSSVTVGLHYGGSALPPLVDRILADELRRAGGKLDRRILRSPPP